MAQEFAQMQLFWEEDQYLIPMPEDQATFRARIDKSITEMETTLFWHSKIGWWAIGSTIAALVVLVGGLLTWYLPKELSGYPTKLELKEVSGKFDTLSSKLDALSDSLNKFMALRVAGLISNVEKSRKTSPSKLASNFQQVNLLINAAFQSEVPANAELLIRSRTELRDVLNHVILPPAVRNEGISTFGHVDAYAAFSQNVLGKVPIIKEAPPIQPNAPVKALFTATMPLTLSSFSVVDPARQGIALVFVPPDFHGNVLVYDVRLVGVSQHLSKVKWLNVDFVGSTISYDGGPLNLENVAFEGCTFKFGSDENSKKVLKAIQNAQDKSITLVSEFF